MAEVVTIRLKMLANLLARLRTLRKVRTLSAVTPNPVWLSSRRELLMTQVRAQRGVVPVATDEAINLRQRLAAAWLTTRSLVSASKEAMASRGLATAFAAILLMLGSAAGLVRASDQSVPGDSLYTVKLTAEGLRLKLATKPQKRVALQTEFATRRLAELSTLNSQGAATLPRTETLVGEFENNIQDAVAMVNSVSSSAPERASEVASLVNDQLHQYEQTLRSTSSKDSAAAKPVGRALAAVNRASTAALKVIAGKAGKNSEQAPVIESKINDKIQQTENLLQQADTKLAVVAGGAKIKTTITKETVEDKEAKAETNDAIDKSAVAKTNLAEAKRKVKEGDYQAALNILETVQDIVEEVATVADKNAVPAPGVAPADSITSPEVKPSAASPGPEAVNP